MSHFPVNLQIPQKISPTHFQRGQGLRIALLGYRSHPHVGGQGIYIHYLSKALTALGHQVDVISGPPYPDLVDGVRLIQLPSLDLYATPHPTRALRFKHLLSLADTYEWWSKLSGGFGEPYCFGRRLVNYFKREKPQYDIVHDNQSLCYGLLKLEEQGYCVIATVHHPITRDRDIALAAATSKGHRWLVNRWYHFLAMQTKVVQKLSHIVTVSTQSSKDIVEAFHCDSTKINIIPNGVDTDIFKPLAQIERQPLRIMTTASSDQPIKGLGILLKAIARVRVHYPQIKLVVIGKLKTGGTTESELKKLELANHIEFLSGISTEQLVEEYARAQIAVVPSLYEGFGLPAGEALACGVPLICSDGGALPEVVGNAAYQVKAGDVTAMTQALLDLLADETHRAKLSTAGRAHSLQHLSWQVVAEKLAAYYGECIAARAAKC